MGILIMWAIIQAMAGLVQSHLMRKRKSGPLQLYFIDDNSEALRDVTIT